MKELIMLRAADIPEQVLQRSFHTPVLVQFTANWCGPCRLQKPLLLKLAGMYESRLEVMFADVIECAVFAHECGILGVPQLRLFVGGSIVMQAEGLIPEANLLQRLQPWLQTM